MLLVTATGCTQPTEEVHYIKVDMIACSFQGTDAVPVRITISSNPGPWSAEPSASWIRITEQTEEGIVLTADDNPASTEREGEITVTAGEMTKTIRVTQTGDTFVPARYDVFRDYTMGAVISPNGRYTAGFIGVPDENATDHWLLQVVITDLESGEQYLPAPFLDSLYPLYDPCAITDSGTAWDGLESGLIWWDREGTPRWVGDKVRKLKSVKIYDTATGTYTDYTLVDGIVGSSDPYYMSPSGKWIAGTYRTEELAENETDVIYTSCPAFYDTETDEVHIFSEYEGAVGMTVTDEGLGVIGMNGASGIISHTVMVNIPTATEAGTSTEWIYDTYGIIIPDNSLLEYISPDGRTAFGYDLSGEMEPMRKWYVTRKTAE